MGMNRSIPTPGPYGPHDRRRSQGLGGMVLRPANSCKPTNTEIEMGPMTRQRAGEGGRAPSVLGPRAGIWAPPLKLRLADRATPPRNPALHVGRNAPAANPRSLSSHAERTILCRKH